jgi:hypothetical protein
MWFTCISCIISLLCAYVCILITVIRLTKFKIVMTRVTRLGELLFSLGIFLENSRSGQNCWPPFFHGKSCICINFDKNELGAVLSYFSQTHLVTLVMTKNSFARDDRAAKTGWAINLRLWRVQQIKPITFGFLPVSTTFPTRVARFFLVLKVSKRGKMYQMTTKFHKIKQTVIMTMYEGFIKYTKNFHLRLSKLYQKLDFWSENMPSGNPVPDTCFSLRRKRNTLRRLNKQAEIKRSWVSSHDPLCLSSSSALHFFRLFFLGPPPC